VRAFSTIRTHIAPAALHVYFHLCMPPRHLAHATTVRLDLAGGTCVQKAVRRLAHGDTVRVAWTPRVLLSRPWGTMVLRTLCLYDRSSKGDLATKQDGSSMMRRIAR
jgi:hypothetical protein